MLNRTHPTHSARAALLLALAACGPEKQSTANTSANTEITPTSSTSSTSSTTDTPTTSSGDPGTPATCPDHPQTDACCCFEFYVTEELGPITTQSACGLQPLCPMLEFECLMGTVCDDMTTEDEAAIDCVLQALASGESGQVSYQIIGDGGYLSRYIELDIVGDGTLFRQGVYVEDLDFESYAVTRVPLPPATYFSECLALDSWRPRFDCLRAAPYTAPLETCIDGRPFDWDWCTGMDYDTC